MTLVSHALTTLADLKSLLGITSTSHDALLSTLISTSTDFIQSYCGRTFQQTAHSQIEIDGQGSDSLILPNYPVDASASFVLQYRTSSLREASWETLDSKYYYVDWNEGMIIRAGGSWRLPEGKFAKGKRNYRVTYTAGYYLPGDVGYVGDGSQALDLPYDLQYVCQKLAGTIFSKRKGEAGVKAESIGSYRADYHKGVMESPEIQEILDKYARLDTRGLQ